MLSTDLNTDRNYYQDRPRASKSNSEKNINERRLKYFSPKIFELVVLFNKNLRFTWYWQDMIH